MNNARITCAAGLVALSLAGSGLPPSVTPAAAVGTCVFDWAVPGPYDITGNFRGRTETTTARLTNDCRVTIALPGVFTGGPVRRAGDCLQFSFRVEGERQAFTARWCDSYAVVPWQGRNIRAEVVRRRGRPHQFDR
ncbi:MAG: hypothetical protein ACOC71_00385 [Hyphomicrobiales bacterium]